MLFVLQHPLTNLSYILVATVFTQIVTTSSNHGDLCLIGGNVRGICVRYEECTSANNYQPSENYWCETQSEHIGTALICCRDYDGKVNSQRHKILRNVLMGLTENQAKDEEIDAETIYDFKQAFEQPEVSDRKKHSISIASYNRRQTNEQEEYPGKSIAEPNYLRPSYVQQDENSEKTSRHYLQTPVTRPYISNNYKQKQNYSYGNSSTSHNLQRPHSTSGTDIHSVDGHYDWQQQKPANFNHASHETHRNNQTWHNFERTTTPRHYYERTTSKTHNYERTTEETHQYDRTTKRNAWQHAPRPLIEDENGYPVPPPPTSRRPPVNMQSHKPRPIVKRISEMKCKEYSELVSETVAGLPLTTDPKPVEINIQKCNYNAHQLIVGGQNTSVGEFPHMAAVGFLDRRRRTIAWNCGGSLISEHFVLTAAHCTTSSLGTPSVVRLGEYNLKRGDDGAHPVDYLVKEVVRHPDYHPPVRYNDIALLRLSRSVAFTPHIRPACLYGKPTVTNEKTIATGWGRMQYAEDQSDVLLKVVLSVISNHKCNELYQGESKTEVLSKGIVAQQICAGELTGGKDTCQGDSGGPIEIRTQENKCIHHVIGVTSFGKRCAQANAPGVYTRVSSYLTWLESVVWPELVLALQTNHSYPHNQS